MRRANAAITLLHFGEPGPAWSLLRHATDPTTRSYLIHGLAVRGADPRALMARYDAESDVSARRALLLSLGECDFVKLPQADRDRFVTRLETDFRSHPDAGLHGAADWLLRQRWGQAPELDRMLESPRGQPVPGRDWYVNGQGQTYSVIRGPVEFAMGSPPDEKGRDEGPCEAQHPQRIGHSFAIAAREVTVGEYKRFQKDFQYRKQFSPDNDGPVNNVNWYDAVAYCRWLSEQEGIPESQMCYPPLGEIKPGLRLSGDHLTRSGYRLPTQAEWQYACRAGATTPRPFGRGTGLLGEYAWGLTNSHNRLWPCGRLKPNDLGLFDMLGNAWEWCEDQTAGDAGEPMRVMCSGAFDADASDLRSASCFGSLPEVKYRTVSFRPVRTLR
jgi:hypothetical protein